MTLELVPEEDRAIVEGLLQFYVYDFSEMDPIDSDAFAFDEYGLFTPFPGIDDYWRNEGAYPLLVRFDGRPAGLVLINTLSHVDGGTVERNMGEFFVARQYRRAGVATEALHQTLRLYPGRWEFAVVERNEKAKAFWPRAIAAARNVSDIACVAGDGVHWTGPIWSCLAA